MNKVNSNGYKWIAGVLFSIVLGLLGSIGNYFLWTLTTKLEKLVEVQNEMSITQKNLVQGQRNIIDLMEDPLN